MVLYSTNTERHRNIEKCLYRKLIAAKKNNIYILNTGLRMSEKSQIEFVNVSE